MLSHLILDRLRRGVRRRPRPLEVVAAEPAGHIDDFADEVQAGHVASPSSSSTTGSRVSTPPIVTSALFLAERSRRQDAATRSARRDRCELRVADLAQRTGRVVRFAPRLRETPRQMLAQARCPVARRAARVRAQATRRHRRRASRSIASGVRAVPVRRDLQDRRAGKTAMREQQVLAKAAAVARRPPRRPTSRRDRRSARAASGCERERHQRRPRRHDARDRTARRARSRTPSRRSSAPTIRRWRPPAMRARAVPCGVATANASVVASDAVDRDTAATTSHRRARIRPSASR